MLLRIFKGNNPGVIVLISVIFIAVWINAFIHPSDVSASQFYTDPMPLFGLLSSLAGKSSLPGVIISSALVILISFLLVNFNTTSFFINERTYLPALLYILASGFFPEYQSLNPALPASILLMLAIIRIIDGYRKPGVGSNFFDAGLLISTGSLFYANLIWFGCLVIIGIALIRTVSIPEVFLALLGLITPYLITFGIYYVAGWDIIALQRLITGNLFQRTEGYLFSRLSIVSIIFASVIVIVSLVYLFALLNTKKIKSRKIFSLLIWCLLISVGIYFIMPSVSVEMVWISAIPASYLLTHYFVFIKKETCT
ncbi:MAG: hypothetical protein IPJ37_02720 [Bacteroidales bacterium]|nr:hypothetical protein [Bacteroidales bacterium]